MISIRNNVSQYTEESTPNVGYEDMVFPPLPEVLYCCSSYSIEWTYTMRRTMQEIIPGIFLGPFSAAQKTKLENLKEKGITHIICVRSAIEAHFIRPIFPEIFKYLTLDIKDTVVENIIPHFPVVKTFLDDCLNNGGKILIHGNAGISRSAALVLAYIMEKYGLTLRKAYEFVQQKRFCIDPNEGFMAQLMEYEPIYKAQRILQHGQTSTELWRNKRSFEER